jgi:hypothetical protein
MNSEQALSIPKWQRFERRFKSSFFYSNPLQVVKLVGEFISPSGKMYKTLAFWGGDSTWGIRFSPSEEDRWAYTTQCTDINNSGLMEVYWKVRPALQTSPGQEASWQVACHLYGGNP